MIQFKSTTTSKSQLLLANTLGYPPNWHVVRTVPHPLLQTQPNTFQDIIYSGDPEIADRYFNHTAAMEKAMKWIDGESMIFDDDGGQMLPVEVLDLEEGDEVEVYYDQERKWNRAVIIEVIEYRDDTRFTVQYTDDDATQTNVCFERIRQINKPTSKPKQQPQSPKDATPSTASSTSTNKRKRRSTELTSMTLEEAEALRSTKSPRKKNSRATDDDDDTAGMEYVPKPNELKVATKMGLPEGWAVDVKPNSRYTFRSPDGELILKSKKAVFRHLGLPLPAHGSSPLDNDDDGNDNDNDNDGSIKKFKKKDTAIIEEGDPPWRTSDHALLGRRVEYSFEDGIKGEGTCTGWISETDVDADGNPGFVSEKSNKPARLFHVTMDVDCPVTSQDFEEFEMEKFMIDNN